jgi:hypothetical protein
MRIILLTAACAALLADLFAGDAPPMGEISLEKLVEALPLKVAENEAERLKILSPHFNPQLCQTTIDLYTKGEVIQSKHPAQSWDERDEQKKAYKENEAYFMLVAHVLIWWCDVKNDIPDADQVKYFEKQHEALQSIIADLVVGNRLQRLKPLAIQMLARKFFCTKVEASFNKFPEWWGDPSTLIKPEDCAAWSTDSKLSLLSIIRHSNDEAFKLKIASTLQNDSDEVVREKVTRFINRGILPGPPSSKEPKPSK